MRYQTFNFQDLYDEAWAKCPLFADDVVLVPRYRIKSVDRYMNLRRKRFIKIISAANATLKGEIKRMKSECIDEDSSEWEYYCHCVADYEMIKSLNPFTHPLASHVPIKLPHRECIKLATTLDEHGQNDYRVIRENVSMRTIGFARIRYIAQVGYDQAVWEAQQKHAQRKWRTQA